MTVTACTLVINLFRTYYEDVMGEPLDGRKLPRAKKEFVDTGAGNGNYELLNNNNNNNNSK